MEYNPTGKEKLPGEFNFTFAGNIGKVQNLENIVRGFGKFVEEYPKSCLNIIGDGSFLKELKHIVDTEGIRNVNMTGRKSLKEMSDYYQASDVLIISLKDVPLYEIMIPSKFQAYLTTHKPIYAIFKGEVSDLVRKNEIGLVASPSDIGEIAQGFSDFVALPEEERKRMADNAVELSEKVFNKMRIIEKINRIIWKK
jgi:Glycosyltransferase